MNKYMTYILMVFILLKALYCFYESKRRPEKCHPLEILLENSLWRNILP